MSIDMTNEYQLPSSMTRPLPDLEMPLTIEEMEGLDESLAFDLFLSDVEELQARQKGKGRQGCLSDSESSLLLWEEELLVAKQNSHDRRMALSMSNAIASDQNAMAALRASERIAERDRAIAFNMSGAAPPRVATYPEETELSGVDFPHEDDYDTVSEVMSSLMGRVDLTSGDATNERGEASASIRSPHAFAKCVSCLDQFPVPQTTDSPCGHVYCNACMKQLFINATKDEELYPPRCCGNVIPADIALRLLDYKELQAFSAKGVECNTIDRVYCADISCSTFIPLRSITGDSANCPTCRKVTHTLCKSLEHPDQDCPSDEPLQQVLSLGESEGWRRCFNCRSMVELGRGCNHISCRCGKQFCYLCGLEWKTCTCEMWHEDRLYDIAHRVAEDEVRAGANAVDRGQALARVVEGLRAHEALGCEHGRRGQWRIIERPQMQCEVCDHHLPQYIFECTACRMLACNRCIRNRLH